MTSARILLYHLSLSPRPCVCSPFHIPVGAKSMTFLSFRHTKRKPKKIANVRPLRSPSPSSGSFVTTNVVEIGDPSSASAEACYAPETLHVDVDIASEPLFGGDPFSSTFRHRASTTNLRQSHDRLSRSRLGGSSSKPLHDDAGWVQPRVSVEPQRFIDYWRLTLRTFQDGRVSGLAVVEDMRVRRCRPRRSFFLT